MYLADEGAQLIMPMPAMASQNDYAAAGIACTLQEANALTFKVPDCCRQRILQCL